MAEQPPLDVPIVLDGGTGYIKIGLAGQDTPMLEIPSIVGRPILRADAYTPTNIQIKDIMCGEEATAARALLQITYPMENGRITLWEDIQHLWDYTFARLGIDTRGRKIVITVPPINPTENRVRMCKIMYERYGFDSVYVGIQARFALLSLGSTTGVVVDSGDGVTHIVPLNKETVNPNTIQTLNVGGRDVTRRLAESLDKRGIALNGSDDLETVRMLKEKLCYISYNPLLDKSLSEETTVLDEAYTLPDGRVIRLGAERFTAPECLFAPDGKDKTELPGIPELLYKAVQAGGHAVEVGPLYANIVLSGGSTMYPGFASRLKKELQQLLFARTHQGIPERYRKSQIQVNVYDPPTRRHMVFSGAALWAKLFMHEPGPWVSHQEFQQSGPEILKQKWDPKILPA